MLVTANSEGAIHELEESYDVGYIAGRTEAAVYLDRFEEGVLRARGYKIGEVVEDRQNWEERRREIAATTEREAVAAKLARDSTPSNGVVFKGKNLVPTPGETVIQRAYTFTNYAGRFLYVEAHNKATTVNGGPIMSVSYSGADGVFRPAVNLSNRNTNNNQGTSPDNNNGISPDGTDCSVNSGANTSCSTTGQQGNKLTDAGQYMYHRVLMPLRGDDANLRAADMRVRVAAAAGTPPTETSFDTSSVTEWAGSALPPRVANFQKDFITKYMDPTESYQRLDQLAAQFPDIAETIQLPHQTDGYQRPAMAMMAGATNPNANPNAANTPLAVQLFSTALGHLGGNNIRAEFRNAGTANSPLSVTVTDGVAQDPDPNDTDITGDPDDGNPYDGINTVPVMVKDITVNLATGADGAPTSTAAQVVAAINADPAASALVTAYTFAGNAGASVVPPSPSRTFGTPPVTDTKVRLSDYLRGGTVYFTATTTGTPPVTTVTRTDARHIQKGPFQMRVLRIGKDRSNTKTGVFIYCQQHAREWVTPITCVETAERLLKNYATDPTTKSYVDNLNIFIVPSVNPDGSHYSFHDGSVQRKNMKNYCPITTTQGGVGQRGAWGVDLNRNNSIGTLFDGYAGASTSCTSETFSGPSEVSEAEIKNEQWIVDNYPGIKFAINIHTHGGYFMWAPGAYIQSGRVTLPAPNIGIEKYFFDVSETILSHIKSSRGTVIPPQRTGPIADVLYSAAGNSADDMYYRKGIIAYSFEAGAQRFTVNPDTGAITRQSVGFQPCFGAVGTGGGQGSCPANGSLVNEGHDSAMEFADGNYGLIQGALEYSQDVTPPQTEIEYSAERTTGGPINYRFKWVNESSVIHYTTDGSTPTTASPTYNNQGPRRPGEVITLDRTGVHDVKWMAVDVKGNQSAVQTKRFLVGAQDVGGTVPATLSLTLGTPASFGALEPAINRDYNASMTANVISSAGNGALSVADHSSANPGHLMNGTFFLPQKLQVSATSLGMSSPPAPLAPVGGSASPTQVLTYGGPVANDPVTVNFRQSIGAADALRTGPYSKTLTFTLSTTSP